MGVGLKTLAHLRNTCVCKREGAVPQSMMDPVFPERKDCGNGQIKSIGDAVRERQGNGLTMFDVHDRLPGDIGECREGILRETALRHEIADLVMDEECFHTRVEKKKRKRGKVSVVIRFGGFGRREYDGEF